MTRGKYLLLLLLAEHIPLGGCQSLTVSMVPNFKEIHVGETFFLRCGSQGKGEVKWFHNNRVVPEMRDGVLKIQVAARKHSGEYHCEANGINSSSRSIRVLGHYPRASLILKTGQPVMQNQGSVILRLDNDQGLWGWKCFVFKGDLLYPIALRLSNNVSIEFQTTKLKYAETIYWCTNKDQSQRSNQVVLRISDNDVSMEMYFSPVVAGEPLTLRCLNWNQEKIDRVVFYKNHEIFEESSSPTRRINSVTESHQGEYKCKVFFGKNEQVSDVQQLVIQEDVSRAEVSGIMGLTCSCPDCPSISGYIWYKIIEDSQPLELPGNRQGFMKPDENGIYACMAVWDYGRTFISKSYSYNPAARITLIISVILIIFLLGLAAAVAFFWKQNQRRRNTGPLYEDVMLKVKDEDRYQRLQGRGAQKESEYDTIQPAKAPPVKKEGDYQPLAKDGMTEGVYHTLGMEGEESGAARGGYEALQRKTRKEEIYPGIGAEGAASEEQN